MRLMLIYCRYNRSREMGKRGFDKGDRWNDIIDFLILWAICILFFVLLFVSQRGYALLVLLGRSMTAVIWPLSQYGIVSFMASSVLTFSRCSFNYDFFFILFFIIIFMMFSFFFIFVIYGELVALLVYCSFKLCTL